MDHYQSIIDQLSKRNPQAVIVFGSYAWGTPHRDSDIDLLVIEDSNKSPMDRMRDIRSFIHTNMPIDVIALTPEESKRYRQHYSFYKKIFTEGKLVYGRI